MAATGQAPAATALAAANPPLPGSDIDSAFWALLPPNVLIRVFLQLSLQELCCCSQTCTAWRSAAAEDRLWQRLLQAHFCRSTPTSSAQSCKQSLMQLKTGSLWSCGSAWPSLTAAIGGAAASSRPTELVKLWSNLPAATASPLERYCRLPGGFAVAAVAAGRSHLVLLSSAGDVMDTRAAAAAALGAVPAPAEPAAVPAALAQEADQAAGAAAGLQEGDALQAAADVDGLQQQQLGVLQLRNPWRPLGATVTSIAAGAGHVVAVTCCGQVWGWGANAHGQLGLGNSQPWVAAPTEVTAALDGAWKADGDVMLSAACGDLHSALLASSGAVYTAGCNRQGQCGQDPQLSVCTVFCQPSHSDSCQERIRAAAVACGTANTGIASRTVCGDATSGQCGQSYMKQRCRWRFTDMGPELGWHGLTRPTAAEVTAAGGDPAQALPKVVNVAVGCGTCYALTDDGDVYAWGAGSKGQLGRGGCAKVQATPAKLPWAKKVVQLSASLDGHFAAAVDATGHLYTWGAGKWGQLGHGDTSKRTVGRAVKQLKQSDVLQVVCGSESLLVLTSDRPLQHATTNTNSSSNTHAGHDTKQQQQQNIMSLLGGTANLTSNSPTAAAAATGNVSMEGVGWVDVEGQGPFCCPAPRTNGGCRGFKTAMSRLRHNTAAAASDLDSPAGSNFRDDSCTAVACHGDVVRVSFADAADDLADDSQLQRCSSSSSASTPWQQQLNPRDKRQQAAAAAAAGASSSSSSAAAAQQLPYAGGCDRRGQQRLQGRGKNHSWEPEVRRSRIAAALAAAAAADRASSQARARRLTGHQQQQQQPQEEALELGEDADANTDDAAAEDAEGGFECGGSNSCSMAEAGGSDGGLPAPRRHPRMDKGFRRLLKQLLKNFAADSRQRELSFPANLSSADRYYVHVAAEAWGLGHASHNEGEERVIKVWKVSRSRRALRSGADPGFGSD